MKKVFLLFITSIFLVSCVSLIKRHYNSGYYISKFNKRKTKQIQQDTFSSIPIISSHLVKDAITHKDSEKYHPPEYRITARVNQPKRDDLIVSKPYQHSLKAPAYLYHHKKVQSPIDSLRPKKEKLQEDNPEDTPKHIKRLKRRTTSIIIIIILYTLFNIWALSTTYTVAEGAAHCAQIVVIFFNFFIFIPSILLFSGFMIYYLIVKKEKFQQEEHRKLLRRYTIWFIIYFVLFLLLFNALFINIPIFWFL